MEGNTLTVEETRSVMIGNLDVHQKPFKDVAEMKGHDEVITEILKIGKGELRLSEKRIKNIHSAIMYEEADVDKEKIGEWKKVDNYILNRKGERYDFLSHQEVPEKVHDLLNRINAAIDLIQSGKKNAPHPLDAALQFHLEFLAIHPFYDGNGRTARILTNLILISLGYPPFWITEKERDTYYSYLTDIQGYGGDANLLNECMANLVLRSQQLILDVVKGKDIDEENDLQKEISLLKRQLEGEKFTKSPKNIHEVFCYSQDKIWISLLGVLNQFDEVFNENKTKRLVNFLDEFFPNKSILDISNVVNPFEKSTKPKEYKIFGHDIYEMDVYSIRWEHKKYGLKNAKKNSQYEVEFSVSFNPYNYKIELQLGYKLIFKEEYAYNEFPDVETIKGIKKDLGNEIVMSIKRDIN